MSNLNANIILQGRQPDIIGSYARGLSTGNALNQINRQREVQDIYRQHGAGAMQGNQNALAAIAGVDPAAAQNLMAGQLGMDQTRLSMDATRQRMDILNAQEMRAIETFKAEKGAAGAAAEAAKIEVAVKQGMALQTPQQWDAFMAQNAPDLVGQFAQKEAIANKFLSMAEILKRQDGPKPADEYGRYAAEENAAGRQPLSRIEYAQAKKGKGFSVTTPDGTTVTYGGPQGGGGVSPSSPDAMIASIDGILNDPALDTATGVYSFLQAIPGTPQRRFGARAAQLEGQAFLQAFESLKGGGQITEIEGRKATEAIGRLDTAQSAGDYRAALTELRDILSAAQARPKGWAAQRGSESRVPDFSAMTDAELDAWIAENGQ